jgi:hypothetical protein
MMRSEKEIRKELDKALEMMVEAETKEEYEYWRGIRDILLWVLGEEIPEYIPEEKE